MGKTDILVNKMRMIFALIIRTFMRSTLFHIRRFTYLHIHILLMPLNVNVGATTPTAICSQFVTVNIVEEHGMWNLTWYKMQKMCCGIFLQNEV